MPVLPYEVFAALAALSWSDGDLRASERAGLLRAAEACKLEAADIGRLTALLDKPFAVSEIDASSLSEWQRIVAYAIGAWLSRIDGVVSTDERQGLKLLAKRFELSDASCERASLAAFDIFVQEGGGKPERFDFVRLESILRERLPSQAKA